MLLSSIKKINFLGSLFSIFLCWPNLAYSANTIEKTKYPLSKAKQIIVNANKKMSDIEKNGSLDLYITGRTWHFHGFSKESLSRFNDHAYGVGFGKRLIDKNGHEDMLYGMLFLESHYEPQFMGGYARQWYYKISKPVSIGIGYSAGVTMRRDIFNGLPFPVILPVGSIKVGRYSIMASVLPLLPKRGIAFIWGRISF